MSIATVPARARRLLQMVCLAVVIPVGPNCNAEFIADTIDSVAYYTSRDRRIILMDDSGKGTGEKVQQMREEVTVLESPRTLGKLGGLYRNLSHAFHHALATCRFKALLRLDTDALIVGPHPEEDAIACFEADPMVGSAGNYLYDYGGKLRSRDWVVHQLQRQTRSIRGVVTRPLGSIALHRVLPRARRNGYEHGEEVFGGACFYSYGAVAAMADNGFLPHAGLSRTNLEEDEIFGIAVRACGFHFADLWEYNQSFACTWRTLPAPPEELQAGPAKVIHSVRDYAAMPEGQLREYFRRYRSGAVA